MSTVRSLPIPPPPHETKIKQNGLGRTIYQCHLNLLLKQKTGHSESYFVYEERIRRCWNKDTTPPPPPPHLSEESSTIKTCSFDVLPNGGGGGAGITAFWYKHQQPLLQIIEGNRVIDYRVPVNLILIIRAVNTHSNWGVFRGGEGSCHPDFFFNGKQVIRLHQHRSSRYRIYCENTRSFIKDLYGR